MYRQENKELYLNEILENEYSQSTYSRIFKLSQELEERYKKDLYDFDKKELEELMYYYIKPQTKATVRTYGHIISSYVQWGIDTNRSKHLTNPFRRNNEYFYKFVTKKSTNIYLPKDVIDNIVNDLKNAQDAFCIQAIFDKIGGNGLSELTSLTINQINEAIENDNILTLKDNQGNIRKVKVSDKTIDLALIAHGEEEYFKKNGQMESYSHFDRAELRITKYILRPTTTGEKHYGEISFSTIYNRLEMIRNLEKYIEYKNALTSKNIERSGMIYEAKKLLEMGEPLDKANRAKICEMYGKKYRWAVSDFLNEDVVNEVYGN